jgi:leader peptidase (prepilin peptidase)/N-methyltransferase
MIVVLLAGLGLVTGSFLNVVIARVPAGGSIIHPRSSCPRCGAFITPRDNIPVLSWVLLRGRCRSCREPISFRYPLVELLTSVTWVLVGAWCLSSKEPMIPALLPTLLIVLSAGIALVFIDIEHHRLPDVIVLPLYPVVLVGLGLAGLATGEWPVTRAVIGAAVWLAAIGGIWLVSGGRAMGFGDVKIAPVLGLVLGWVGWGAAIIGLGSAWLLGGLVGVALLVSGRAKRGQSLAFGPFLIAGFWVGVFVGAALLNMYLQWIGLEPVAIAAGWSDTYEDT